MTIDTNCSAPEAAARALKAVRNYADTMPCTCGQFGGCEPHKIMVFCDQQIAELRAREPQGEPVALRPIAWLYYNTETNGYMPIMKRLQADERYIERPLYTHPDPRVAVYRRLLERVQSEVERTLTPELAKNIRAALGEGK